MAHFTFPPDRLIEPRYTNWYDGGTWGVCIPCLVGDPQRETRTRMQFHWEPSIDDGKDGVGNIPMYCCSERCVATTGRRLRPVEYLQVVYPSSAPPYVWSKLFRAYEIGLLVSSGFNAVFDLGPLLPDGQSLNQSETPLRVESEEAHETHDRGGVPPGSFSPDVGDPVGVLTPAGGGLGGFGVDGPATPQAGG